MIVTKIKPSNLTTPPGIGKDDTSSRQVAEQVSEQQENNPSGITQIETGPGDTLESVAKGHLKGSGQKVDLGNLHAQQNILSKNFDKIQENMDANGSKNPQDFRTFKGRELPQGIKLDLETSHTQNSITPANPMERSQPSNTCGQNDDASDDTAKTDPINQQNKSDNNNKYAGAGSISNTQYALEMQDIGLSEEVKEGMAKFLAPSKWKWG